MGLSSSSLIVLRRDPVRHNGTFCSWVACDTRVDEVAQFPEIPGAAAMEHRPVVPNHEIPDAPAVAEDARWSTSQLVQLREELCGLPVREALHTEGVAADVERC